MTNAQKTGPRRCLVCRTELPDTARANRLYCSQPCSERGRKRRQRNEPIADPVLSSHRASQLEEELRAKEKRIARLEALVKRQREISARNRSRANDAKSAVATARDRQRKTEMEKTQALEGRISAYLERIADMEVEAERLRRQHQVDVKDIANFHAAHDFALEQSMRFKKQMKTANTTIARLQAALGAPPAIFVDYQYFAQWYFRKKPGREWDDHDHNRYLRFKKFVAKPDESGQSRQHKTSSAMLQRKMARIKAHQNQTATNQK